VFHNIYFSKVHKLLAKDGERASNNNEEKADGIPSSQGSSEKITPLKRKYRLTRQCTQK